MRHILILSAIVTAVTVSAGRAGEIGYIEDFALAEDRAQALQQLIPGTRDYYYYHCVHHQNLGNLDEVDQLLQRWRTRFRKSLRIREIENRQALLRYDRQPAKTLEYLRRRLGLRFSHQRVVPGRKPDLPTSLDPKLITRQRLTQRALKQHKDTLAGFEDRALDWVIARNLSDSRRHHLLRRLKRPDYPNLPALVVADLKTKHSRGFGSLPIHNNLLLAQLDECLTLDPKLIHSEAFVYAYLAKLQHAPDVDWRHDAKARQAYLDRMWAFVSPLAPKFNSLKANVLYRRLVHDRALGVWDAERFMTYIKLPRQAVYVRPEYLRKHPDRGHRVNLGADFAAHTLLPPIRTDQPLVRSYLLHFFVQAADYNAYLEYLRESYLKSAFAEAKLVHGVGDAEQWYAMIGPTQVKALKERVDIDFAHTNPMFFGPDQPVALDAHVKNVQTLIVKVYEVNAANYYRKYGREVSTDVNLDGLVANAERVVKYEQPPIRRQKRTFEFPELSKRGVYVVDLIGSGRNSRALIRKGKLRHLVRTSTAGHIFTVLDEKNRALPDATILLGSNKYAADEDGTIAVPFTNKPGPAHVILGHGEFTSLDGFNHEAENYQFSAGIYVDREALLRRSMAEVMVRPMLRINGVPVTLSVLEEVSLTITTLDRDNVPTSKKVDDFKLYEDRASAYAFRVADDLRQVRFDLTAKVKNRSRSKKETLSVSETFSLNGIDATEKVEDLHLLKAEGSYVVELRGKTGEAKVDRPVQVVLKHRDFREQVHVSLKTDVDGRIRLGRLTDIAWFAAAGPEGTQHKWNLTADRCAYVDVIHARAGEAVRVPYLGAAKQASPAVVSLLERRGSTYLADRRDAVRIEGGFLVVRDVPAGDYELWLNETGRKIDLRLIPGEVRLGHVLGEVRHAQVLNARPLHITDVKADDEKLTVRLANATPWTRVHVLATRFVPEYPVYAHLTRVGYLNPAMRRVAKLDSLYLAGRNIGDEYRYIIDRTYAEKFPGNMLKRPELLLNPWAIRKTEAGVQVAAEGEAFVRVEEARSLSAEAAAAATAPAPSGENFANLDFLASPSAVLVNIEPDADGVVTVELKDLGPHQYIHVAAVDPDNTVYRQITTAEHKAEMRDLRLVRSLDPIKHFSEQKQTATLTKGGRLVLTDAASGKVEIYDSVGKAYRLLQTLSNDATLREFGFIVNWPTLTDAEKRRLYSKYACHELSFFLARKDPAFFDKAVQPYLRNKKDKTFLDHWLIEADVSTYLKPWAHGRLNVVERILLAQRIANEPPHTKRHVGDLYDLLPPDVARFNHLFDTALKGSSLEDAGIVLRGYAAGGDVARDLKELQLGTSFNTYAVERADSPAVGGVIELKKRRGAKAPGKARFKPDDDKGVRVRQLYRKLDKTREWAENNYYHLAIERQLADLITVNAFWRDYAAHDGNGPFLSGNLAEASRNFPDMMLALAVLDLPFEPAEHKTDLAEGRFALTAGGNAIVYHKQIRPAEPADAVTPILVSQNFFRRDDRYRHEQGQKLEKYVTDEFLVHTVYGCHVVVTNPTSAPQKLDLLLQIPRGAIPVLNGKFTRGVHVELQPYHTQSLEYHFYFPAAGQASHFPVHAAGNGKLIAFAEPVTLNVVEKLSRIDRASWAWISQNGTKEQVMAFLHAANLGRIDLGQIAWRVKDKAFFGQVISLLSRRHVVHDTLYSYGIKHNVMPVIREYLQHRDKFLQSCGEYIDTTLVTIDPVLRHSYQHLEYSPLVNARAHRLGKRRQIVNERMSAQYHRLLKILGYRRELDDTDAMAVTYHMLLQGRIAEAKGFFAKVDSAKLPTRLQHDYFAAYMDFFNDSPTVAREIAARYADHPVDRWRKVFAAVTAQLDEIDGRRPAVIDEEDRTQQQTQLAATQPSFELSVEAGQITVHYRNLKRCRVNYYPMDIELLFSRSPFMQQYAGEFSLIRPNRSDTIELPADKTTHEFALPEQFDGANVMVEVAAAGVSKAKAHLANVLAVQLAENYGQLTVTHAKTGKVLPKVYVKVYARMTGGEVQFFKDGYTDLRGRFDYTSLNTDELNRVKRLAILVFSDKHGTVVREAAPPKR